MALIDTLRSAVGSVPPSHVPTPAELPDVLGALIAHVEHGDEAFKQAADDGHDGFVNLLAPKPEEPEPAAESSSSAADPAPDDRDARIAELEQQLATATAAAQRTTAGEPQAEAPAEQAPPAAPPNPSTTEGGW